MLEVFMRHPNAVLSRTALAERIWGSTYYVSDNAIDVTVSGLRQRLSAAYVEHASSTPDEADTPFLETVRGAGYRLTAPTLS